MEKKVKILVCCHKADIFENKEPYLPIHVGKAVSAAELPVQTDDEGENISAKNGSYCELTGMYWAWKNLKDTDIVGLCHYRRYFDFHNQAKSWAPYTLFGTKDFDSTDRSVPDSIIDEVASGKIVVTKETNCQFNLMVDYCSNHNSDDFRVMQKVICKTQPENVKRAFYDVMYAGNKKMTYNMFIMKWSDFEAYCSWLFALLGEIESRIDISHYNAVQKRIFGYMGERLLNVWLLANKKVLIKKPVLWYADVDDGMSNYSRIKYFIRSTMNNISMYLGRAKYHNVMC